MSGVARSVDEPDMPELRKCSLCGETDQLTPEIRRIETPERDKYELFFRCRDEAACAERGLAYEAFKRGEAAAVAPLIEKAEEETE